jgi:23S rRNA pseudouridine1911/1915/1917 synthase
MGSDFTEFTAKIGRRSAGLYLLDYLRDCIPLQSELHWLALLKAGLVCVDGQTVFVSEPLVLGCRVSYKIAGYREPDVPTNWSILWEGELVLALHKPAGLPVSRTTRNIENNLINLVQRDSPWPDAHLLHRLDKETSGIILVGKNKAAAQSLQPQLPQLLQRKVYRAVVHGAPQWSHTTYECHLGTQDEAAIRCQMHVCEDGQGHYSKTAFTLIERLGSYSLIECELFTGRKHQIRAHLAALGLPIVGDKIYAHDGRYFIKRCEDDLDEADIVALGSSHHLLHAYHVELGLGLDVVVTDEIYPEAWKCYVNKNVENV